MPAKTPSARALGKKIAPKNIAPKKIKLALQGGGAHGAFTWGVLDAILEDERLEIEAISGASAGAMNAVVLADGLCDGGRDTARAQLERFWRKASLDGGLPTAARTVFDTVFSAFSFGKGASNPWFDLLAHSASPYDFNPLNINPLQDILASEIDFKRLNSRAPLRLYISATHVDTGKVRVFRETELTAAHVAASACLPMIFRAVMIEEAAYWDGGYTGNPPLYPLFEGESRDLMLVQINPILRKGVPQSALDIQHRLNEISFNAPLLHEMRAIEFVARLIDTGVLTDPRYKRILMHRIAMSETVEASAGSKLSVEFSFFLKLRDAGRKAAKDWLKSNYSALGSHETLDLRQEIH